MIIVRAWHVDNFNRPVVKSDQKCKVSGQVSNDHVEINIPGSSVGQLVATHTIKIDAVVVTVSNNVVFGEDLDFPALRLTGRVTDQEVDARAGEQHVALPVDTVDQLSGVVVATNDQVVARAAMQAVGVLITTQRIVAGAAFHVVTAGTAEHDVVAITTEHTVVTGITEQQVVAGHVTVPLVTINGVVVVTTMQLVVAGAAFHGVFTGITEGKIVSTVHFERVGTQASTARLPESNAVGVLVAGDPIRAGAHIEECTVSMNDHFIGRSTRALEERVGRPVVERISCKGVRSPVREHRQEHHRRAGHVEQALV